MSVTINDIAKKSGVSLATVSRVINHSPHVSPASKEKVENAIKELNYIPNAYARGLSKSQSDIIGVIIPEITNPFFSEIIKGITEIGDKNNLNILLFNTDENADKEERALRILQEYRIRGLIITPVTGINEYDRDYVKRFEILNIPIVLMDRSIKNSDFDGIYFDDRTAIFKTTCLLIEQGHRDIAALIGNPNHVVSKARVQGYVDAFEAHQITYDPKRLIPGEFSIESSYKLTKQLILEHQLPTALLGMTNMLSMGCLKALYEYGISIPEEVAFAGYDQLEMHDVLHLNLTLVEKDAQEMGRRAARLLIDKLSGDTASNKTILMPELCVRGSEQYPVRDPNLRIFQS
jgi:LacI family transcriptional regulator